MSGNLEKYNKAFMDVFDIEESFFDEEISKDTVESWDSVHQLSLVAALEDEFDIMFDAEDILELTSYEEGKKMLLKYNVEI